MLVWPSRSFSHYASSWMGRNTHQEIFFDSIGPGIGYQNSWLHFWCHVLKIEKAITFVSSWKQYRQFCRGSVQVIPFYIFSSSLQFSIQCWTHWFIHFLVKTFVVRQLWSYKDTWEENEFLTNRWTCHQSKWFYIEANSLANSYDGFLKDGSGKNIC